MGYYPHERIVEDMIHLLKQNDQASDFCEKRGEFFQHPIERIFRDVEDFLREKKSSGAVREIVMHFLEMKENLEETNKKPHPYQRIKY